MLDTVKLLSPRLGAALLDDCRRSLDRVSREDPDGVPEYEIFTGSLVGSYDHRTSVKIDEIEGCLILEGSVHKAICGHNVGVGPCDFVAPCRWYVNHIATVLGVDLPDGAVWRPRRIDWAECFVCASPEAIRAIIKCYQRSDFTRRGQPNCFKDHGVSWASDRSSLKAYHKGQEFRTHDAPRLRKAYATEIAKELSREASSTETGQLSTQACYESFMSNLQLFIGAEATEILTDVSSLGEVDLSASGDQLLMFANPAFLVDNLAAVADRLLRVEVELKRRALTDASYWYYGDQTTVSDVEVWRIQREWALTVDKVTKESKTQMQKVADSLDVHARLRELYTDADAQALHGTYLKLSYHGERATLSMMKRSTFFLHKKKLLSAVTHRITT